MMIMIGFQNYVNLDRIVSIVAPNSNPIKQMINNARENGKLINATMGKKTRSVIITNSDHIVLSASLPDTIIHRIRLANQKPNSSEPELC